MFHNQIGMDIDNNSKSVAKNQVNISPCSWGRALTSFQKNETRQTEEKPPTKARKLNNAKKQPSRL